jgi:hypothetical protein
MRLATTTLTALLTTLALGATACGSEEDDFADSSVEDIQKAAVADMKDASSLKMSGSFTNGEQEQTLDVSMNTEGECTGTLEVGGGSAEFISLADAAYLKGDQDFWEATTGDPNQAAAVMALVGDKWAKVPGGGEGFGDACDLESLLDGLEEEDGEAKAEKGEETEVDGQEAIELVSEEDGETTTALVSLEDPHYILSVEVTGGDEPGSFTFSEFDEEIDLAAPAEDEVVDLSQQG